MPAEGKVRAVVVVLHGGKVASREPVRAWHLSRLRMLPFARAIHRRTRNEGVATWMLAYRYRGWNGAEASPVADTVWALDEVRERHGDVPVVLVGHSMGGRAALRSAGDPNVATVVALAPWLEPGDPVEPARNRSIAILHAPGDRWTSAARSQAWASAAARIATKVSHTLVPGAGHFMLKRAAHWQKLTVDAVLEGLALAVS